MAYSALPSNHRNGVMLCIWISSLRMELLAIALELRDLGSDEIFDAGIRRTAC
jgi:hypothetical protein